MPKKLAIFMALFTTSVAFGSVAWANDPFFSLGIPCLRAKTDPHGILPAEFCFKRFDYWRGGTSVPAIGAQFGHQTAFLVAVGRYSEGEHSWMRFEGPLFSSSGENCSESLETRVSFDLDTDGEDTPFLRGGESFTIRYHYQADSCHSPVQSGEVTYLVNDFVPISSP